MALVKGTKRKKSYFFQITSSGGIKGVRFLRKDRPREQTYRDFLESVTFHSEVEDRSKAYDPTKTISEYHGLSGRARDEDVKSYIDADNSKSLHVQPHQVTEVAQGANDVINAFDDKTIEIVKDPSEGKRNKFLLRLTDPFKTYLATLSGLPTVVWDQTVSDTTPVVGVYGKGYTANGDVKSVVVLPDINSDPAIPDGSVIGVRTDSKEFSAVRAVSYVGGIEYDAADLSAGETAILKYDKSADMWERVTSNERTGKSFIDLTDKRANTSGYLIEKIIAGSGILVNRIVQSGVAKLQIVSNIPVLQSYYVDGNNPVDGDGSILSPFRTIDLMLTKIDDDTLTNITVKVSGAVYTATRNMARSGVNWSFEDGVTINATDITGGILYDCSANTADFIVTGYPNYNLVNTMLLRCTGVKKSVGTFEIGICSSIGSTVIELSGISTAASAPAIRGITGYSRINPTADIALKTTSSRFTVSNMSFGTLLLENPLVQLINHIRDATFRYCSFGAEQLGTYADTFISISGANMGKISFLYSRWQLTKGTVIACVKFETGTNTDEEHRDKPIFIGNFVRSDSAGKFTYVYNSASAATINLLSKNCVAQGDSIPTFINGNLSMNGATVADIE